MSPFRFSLRWLLIVVAIVAFLMGLFSFGAGQAIAVWILVAVLRGVLPSMALVGCIFGRGDWRAFSLGALVASVPVVVGSTGLAVLSPWSSIAAVASQLLHCVLCGGGAVGCRRWLSRRGLASDL